MPSLVIGDGGGEVDLAWDHVGGGDQFVRVNLSIYCSRSTMFHGRSFVRNLAGSYSGPPTSWKPEEDGMSTQEVLLYFKGGK